ncbi:CRISPR-associated helicase Cas3' [Nocardiopsis sp. NPDC049922]|uniref:CRISPR-associated helicase Cas3' n=1 Tax=Nocardiopsis sp. NPDC049922 TaxID=3155157 RepID=UPI0033D32276
MADALSAAPPPPLVPVLWGKTGELDPSLSDDAWHPLVSHMVDSVHVAGQVWDHYLSGAVRSALGPPGTARALFAWLAGLHDIGKATPHVQRLSTRHWERVEERAPHPAHVGSLTYRHEQLSAHVVRELLAEEGWSRQATVWVAHVVGGHHGTFPSASRSYTPGPDVLGEKPYRAAWRYLFDLVTEVSGVDLAALRDHVPELGARMTVSGAVVMADWLASNEAYFPYDTATADAKPPVDEYVKASRTLAEEGFRRITRLGGVWRPEPGDDARELYWRRFGIKEPRDTQVRVDEVARRADRPGLMVVEAPTGEGKTEAALAAAEVLAERFGLNGLFFALPTQATTNSVFDRILDDWAHSQRHKPTVALVHGKARLRESFTDLPSGGVGDGGCHTITASSWLRGAKKALLSPIAIGTIDQLLFAGVAARYVQLRHLGLANKVVVVDEVHAYDTYMSQILHRVLHWLGWHGVPVVLLSATLPPGQRADLLAAYSGAPEVAVEGTGYPRVTWVDSPSPEQRLDWAEDDDQVLTVRSDSATTRRGADVRIAFAPERPGGDLRELIEERLRGVRKGNILVLRNTVQRAQDAYDRLRAQFPDFDVSLAHARFTARDRERIDDDLVRRYGPPDKPGERPTRSIVVATQVAEQSLDVDFDLVVSDLAPIDLLLQRAGRCHRHARPASVRGSLTAPTLVVTGYHDGGDGPPGMISARTRRPYEHHLLLRTMAVLTHPEPRGSVSVPGDVPDLIARVYGDAEIGPESWRDVMAAATTEAESHRVELSSRARTVLLGLPDPGAPSLAAVHPFGNDHEVPDDEEQAAHMLPVRHGADSVEVILLRRTGPNTAETVSRTGEPPVAMPLDRTPPRRLVRAIGDQAIRLPRWQVGDAPPTCPKGWEHAPWARRLRVLVLDQNGSTRRNGTAYHYSSDTGWTPSA